MSDKPLVQQQLASTLAALQLTVRKENAIPFVGAFWDIMCREWAGIDRIRLDKYYLLLRFFISSSFKLLATYKWEDQIVDDYVEMLSSGPLHPTNHRKPDSIKFHFADVYLDELEKLFKQAESATVPSTKLLYPFYSLLASTRTNTVFNRVQENIFERLIHQHEEADFDYDMTGIATHLFETGADRNTLDANRRKIYLLYGKFEEFTEADAPQVPLQEDNPEANGVAVTNGHQEDEEEWIDEVEPEETKTSSKDEKKSKKRKRTEEPTTNGTKKVSKRKKSADATTPSHNNDDSTPTISTSTIKFTKPIRTGVLINPSKLKGKAVRIKKRVTWGGVQARTIPSRKARF